MTTIEDPDCTVHPRLHDVACLLACTLVRMRMQPEVSDSEPVDLDNASELRVYDRTFKPQRRKT
ncbi:hypothetical protein ACTOWJ_26910 [Lysobacter sp. CA199]